MMKTTTNNGSTTSSSSSDVLQLQICSLSDLEIDLSEEIRNNLSKQYHLDEDDNHNVVEKILQAMKRPPATTICRVNQLLATREEIISTLKTTLNNYNNIQVLPHDIFDDVVVITGKDDDDDDDDDNDCNKITTTNDSNKKLQSAKPPPPLPPCFFSSIPIQPKSPVRNNNNNNNNNNDNQNLDIPSNDDEKKKKNTSGVLFKNWPSRERKGWPMTHRVVICDRFCGEAILRGSDIFVKGLICADRGIQCGEMVAVYAEIPIGGTVATKTHKPISRGSILDHYNHGRCVFLGLGKAVCSREEMFRLSHGVAIEMCRHDVTSSVVGGPKSGGGGLPPLSGILTDKMMLQNLPSVLVGHALQPQENDIILDMCCAPGGKSAHLASLVKNRATIVSCDKSRKKVLAARTWFQNLGATCITPLVLDSTKCCLEEDEDEEGGGTFQSISEIIQQAAINKDDGLKDIQKFPPESFDRILLDPPCSALGLRPKLFIPQSKWHELEKHATYQQKFVQQAVKLLKPGGFMTYSTCTINALENECMVSYMLKEFSCLELLPIPYNSYSSSSSLLLGRQGLRGHGLDDDMQRDKVRRFDPHDECADTMGFFVALFRKKETKRKRTTIES